MNTPITWIGRQPAPMELTVVLGREAIATAANDSDAHEAGSPAANVVPIKRPH